VVLVAMKIAATSFTLGSGGSAGDFGPSLALGGLVGGAFGRAAQLLVSPAIDPGAFALVGMGTFYGGIAHTPVSSLVMVCEMAGTYDLLPSLMLTSGLAFVLLRDVSLYPRQPRSRFESPAHVGEESLDVLKRLRVGDTCRRGQIVTFRADAPLAKVVDAVVAAPEWQSSFPVVDESGALAGIVSSDVLRAIVHEEAPGALVIAADMMRPAMFLAPADDLHTALERFIESGLDELPVVEDGRVTGLLDEGHITRAYHDYLARLGQDRVTPSVSGSIQAIPAAPDKDDEE
jgi:CIC family chloride channel protein